jgi:tRNA-dihydrouridine synthase B
VPVTVKIRKGYDDKSENAVLLAKIAQDKGAKMVTVHGRTVRQMYSGKADWSVIRRVKEAVGIPVVGNGDVVDGPSAVKMLNETGCDGIMVGRAAVGRPWVFTDIISYMRDGSTPLQLPTEQAQGIIREHFDLLTSYAGERKAALLMRKYLCSYTRGLPYSSEFRRKCLDLHGRKDFEDLLAQFPSAQTLVAELKKETGPTDSKQEG